MRFWKDLWLDDCSLCVSYPSLFDICQAQDWTFDKVVECDFNLPFRRRLLPVMENQWEYVVSSATNMERVESPDGVAWLLTPKVLMAFLDQIRLSISRKDLSGPNNKRI